MRSIRIKQISLLATAMMLLASCATKHISYFQDATTERTLQMTAAQDITMKPGDKVSIVVSSKDPELAAILNLPIVSQRTGYTGDVLTMAQQQVSAYTLDGEGNIDFPMLGKVNLSGLNRNSAASLIKEKIVNAKLAQDPIVTVEYMNLHIDVLGEVRSPGRITLSDDQYTLFDALSKAGDLTVYGERQNVRVFRQVEGKQQTFLFDLTSDSATISNPGFYLQQGDIVYVTPNKKKARESTVNGNNVLSASFWISVSSLVATVASIVVASKK